MAVLPLPTTDNENNGLYVMHLGGDVLEGANHSDVTALYSRAAEKFQ